MCCGYIALLTGKFEDIKFAIPLLLCCIAFFMLWHQPNALLLFYCLIAMDLVDSF